MSANRGSRRFLTHGCWEFSRHSGGGGAMGRNGETFNVQRSTFNFQRGASRERRGPFALPTAAGRDIGDPGVCVAEAASGARYRASPVKGNPTKSRIPASPALCRGQERLGEPEKAACSGTCGSRIWASPVPVLKGDPTKSRQGSVVRAEWLPRARRLAAGFWHAGGQERMGAARVIRLNQGKR